MLPIKDKARFQLNKQLWKRVWKRVNLFWSTIVASFIGWCDYQWRACLGIEPRTSRSQSENHTTRPTGHFWLRCIPYPSDVSIHKEECVVLLLTARFYWNPIQQNKLYDDMIICTLCYMWYRAEIAQLGERQTEDLKVPGSIPGLGKDNDQHVL